MRSQRRGAAAPALPVLAAVAGAVTLLLPAATHGRGGGQTQIATTGQDFFQPGTQPDPTGMVLLPFEESAGCTGCHADYLDPVQAEPYDTWRASMMAQSARDPVWQAAVSIANQDAANAGETCIRCHAPKAWLEGRSTGGDLAALAPGDFDGINCHFCHRSVNPVLSVDSPVEDDPIIMALQSAGLDFSQHGNARFAVDPDDVRRGPFFDVPMNMHGVPIIPSPFHRQSELCAACHDVSIPTYTRQPDGTYQLNALDAPHPTQNIHDMFPEQRTYSEWKFSDFAAGGVVFPDGRFGGNLTAVLPNTVPVSSCQDCHMPDADTGGCAFWESSPFFGRPDMPRHFLHGANTWVLGAVLDIYGILETGLTETEVQEAFDRTEALLQAASDLELSQVGDDLNVRVINVTGHKLPTGYPEGRRMWVTVRFYDANDNLLLEHGAYDDALAELDEAGTKVYRADHGIDAAVAAATGLPVGTRNHLALSNKVYLDNRIPPMGFTNANYDAIGAAPVGYAYADGQHWDDTSFAIPPCAVRADVSVHFQTTSREYAEFLRDTVAGPAPNAGTVAYDAWVARGRSAPVEMDAGSINGLLGAVTGDTNGDGVTDGVDLVSVILAWGACAPPGAVCPADTNCDGAVDGVDLVNVILNWTR